ncbi:MAG: electron transport complex subunit RsxC [Bacteroidaceae bacterium]|nr:electron transport complex subunit RsxC [Bacteroidaceae bacterium]
MMKTFHIGGVHPAENKLSAGSPIREAALPKQAVFSMFQHIGAPAKPVVQKGDVVKVGTLLAEAGGFVSAPVYSSVSGKVNKIDAVIDASGTRRMAVIVDVEGDEWEEGIDRSKDLVRLSDRPDLDSKTIVEKIKNAGIVGLGGATFPCHVKLTPPPGSKAECVIINAVECEPYLTADHRLMLEHADEILVGVDLIMKAVNVTKGYIGIENNKPDAIKLMTEKAGQYPNIEVVPLKVKYPQGGEKQLIDAVIGRQVPAPPAIPISVGAVVQNVGTAFAIYEAVMKNKPLIDRIITVTGKSVKNPSNLLARLGTPFQQLIDECGGLPEDTGKIIGGGPMMGKALLSLDVPMTKGSSGLLIMNEKEARRSEPQPCIRCAKCVSACPMGLEPFLLSKASALEKWEMAEKNDVVSCIECGSCQFTCPSKRPLLDMIRVGKTTVMGIIRNRAAAKK